MKKIFRWILGTIFAICTAMLCGCSLNYTLVEEENFAFGVGKNDVFLSLCFWREGDDKTILIPDEYQGKPITALGGYTGRGYPCPFAVCLSDSEYDWSASEDWVALHASTDPCRTLVFRIRLGKNIRTFSRASGKTYLGIEREGAEGQTENIALYKIVYSFEVDAENRTFYAENGKLYEKAGDRLIDEFFYE